MIVIGHKNPDTDSIVSAITYAKLCNALGKTAKAYCLGDLNPETRFALEKFGINEPPIISEPRDERFALVDHNSLDESLKGLNESQIVEVIDHHKLSLNTSHPLFVYMEPIGSTTSIIFKLYRQKRIIIEPMLAGAMLSAILSDTVIFKSPTTTKEDKEIADELAGIAGIEDMVSFGIELKKKKSDFSRMSADDIISSDAKEFNFNGKKIKIAQVEVFDWDLRQRKNELLQAMKNKPYDIYALMLTNILTEQTLLLYTGDESIIKRAFTNGKYEENAVLLEKTMSRKKQIVPPLQKACGA